MGLILEARSHTVFFFSPSLFLGSFVLGALLYCRSRRRSLRDIALSKGPGFIQKLCPHDDTTIIESST